MPYPLAANQGQVVRLVEAQLFSPVAVSSSGDNTIVAKQAGQRIRVVSIFLSAANSVSVTFKSSAAGAITGAMPMIAGTPLAGSFPGGILQTAVGEDLVLNLSAGVAVGGSITYILTTNQ